MRLSEDEVIAIKKAFKEVFGEGEIYLFGSRVDDMKKGGDIDLFIKLPYSISIDKILDKKSAFKMMLYDMIGEQQIDVIISRDENRNIEKEIIENGILL